MSDSGSRPLASPRRTLVIAPGKNVGVILHRDGRLRIQRLGPDPQPEPEWRVEEFDLTTDRSWNVAFTDPREIATFHDKADRLDVALGLLEDALDSGRLDRRLANEVADFIEEQKEESS